MLYIFISDYYYYKAMKNASGRFSAQLVRTLSFPSYYLLSNQPVTRYLSPFVTQEPLGLAEILLQEPQWSHCFPLKALWCPALFLLCGAFYLGRNALWRTRGVMWLESGCIFPEKGFITASESFRILKRSDQHMIRNNLGRGVSTNSPCSAVFECWCGRRFGWRPVEEAFGSWLATYIAQTQSKPLSYVVASVSVLKM